jgi:tetratricopeptide (TPR) repeat protein
MGHWREAGHLDKELKYLDSVAEKMIEYQGDYDNAEALLQDALNRLPANDSRRVSLLNWLANIYTAQGQYDTARQIAKDALRITEKIDDQQALANSLESLARVTRAQGEFDDATKIYEQSLSLYRTLGDQGGIASILEELGMIATDQHQLERATTLYQQSLEIKQQLGDQRAIATTLNNLGFVAESQGMPERATELTQKSLEICQQIGDQRGIANALSTLGIIALFQEDYTQTTDYFERCLAMHRQLGEQHNIARTLNNMGYAAKQQGNYAQAIEYYQESLAVKEKLGNKHSMTFTLHNLAGIYYYQEDYEQALKIYQQSLDIYEEIADQRGIAGVTNVMGIIMYKQDKQASDLFHKSLVIAKELQDASMMTMNAIGFATHFMTQGQNIRAAQYCGLAQTRPTRESDIHDYLAELMPKLEAVLSPEDLKTALESRQETRFRHSGTSITRRVWRHAHIKTSTYNHEAYGHPTGCPPCHRHPLAHHFAPLLGDDAIREAQFLVEIIGGGVSVPCTNVSTRQAHLMHFAQAIVDDRRTQAYALVVGMCRHRFPPAQKILPHAP